MIVEGVARSGRGREETAFEDGHGRRRVVCAVGGVILLATETAQPVAVGLLVLALIGLFFTVESRAGL